MYEAKGNAQSPACKYRGTKVITENPNHDRGRDRRRWPETARGCPRGMSPNFCCGAVVLLISLDDHSNPMFSWKELLNLAKRVANKVHPGGSWYMARYFRGFTRFLFCFLRCLLSNK